MLSYVLKVIKFYCSMNTDKAMYRTIIKSVLIYDLEAWTFGESGENTLTI
jgi:hypothetical protein